MLLTPPFRVSYPFHVVRDSLVDDNLALALGLLRRRELRIGIRAGSPPAVPAAGS